VVAVCGVLILPSVRSQDEDAWLAVINQGSEGQQEIVPQQYLQEQQYQQRPPPELQGQRRQGGEQLYEYPDQSIAQSQQPRQPVQPPPQQIKRKPLPRPLPPNQPPPQGPPFARPPPQKRPPPGRRPPQPPPKKGILEEIGGAINGAVQDVSCAAQGVYADEKLQDPVFINQQLDCLLDKGECDDIGKLIKRMAPDVIRGGCHHPCDPCKKKQIQKVMAVLSRKYPRQFQKMLQRFGK